MAISTLNYTGRRKLKRSDTRIYLHQMGDGSLSFDAQLNLSPYILPSNARVYVEAYRQTTWMRFDFGTVGHVVPPQDRLLTIFVSGEAILFRVKVTSGDVRHGLLLAERDRIKESLQEDRDTNKVPLLPVMPDPELGQQIFRVSFEDDRTILCINQQLDWKLLARHQVFRSLVYPEVLRSILVRILHIEKYSDTGDQDDWKSQWLRFASILPGVGDLLNPEDTEDCDDWIESAVTAFSRNHRIMDEFGKHWDEESTNAT